MDAVISPLYQSASSLSELAKYIEGAKSDPIDQSKKYAVDALTAIAFQVNGSAKALSHQLDQQIASCNHASLSIQTLSEKINMCASSYGRREFTRFAPMKQEVSLPSSSSLSIQEAPHTSPLRGNGFVRIPVDYDSLDRVGTGVRSHGAISTDQPASNDLYVQNTSNYGNIYEQFQKPQQQQQQSTQPPIQKPESIYGSLEVTTRYTSAAPPTESLYEQIVPVPRAPSDALASVPSVPAPPTIPSFPTVPTVPQTQPVPEPPSSATAVPPGPPPDAPTSPPSDTPAGLSTNKPPAPPTAPPGPPPAAPPGPPPAAPPGDSNPYGIVIPSSVTPIVSLSGNNDASNLYGCVVATSQAVGDVSERQPLSRGVVQYDYAATAMDELDLEEGQEVEILLKNEDGWFLGRIIGEDKEGLFPGNYVEEIEASIC